MYATGFLLERLSSASHQLVVLALHELEFVPGVSAADDIEALTSAPCAVPLLCAFG